ncbi:MAG: glycosyltransferase, partial [Prevotella sp.]|nr:glycosyltransferase [Prevotella sp.]
MRIFIISNSLTNGGAERVGANLANIFVRSGHEVSLFTDLSQPATYAIDTAVTCYSWRGDLYNKVYKWFYAIRLIHRHIKADHPDIILGMMHLCSFIGRVAAVHSHVPVLLTIHHAVHHMSVRYSLITRFADRWMPLLYSGTTVLTRVDADYYKSHDIPVFVMPNPLTFQPALAVPKKEKMILAAGRLSAIHIKGWDLLIKAWSMLAADYPEWTLVI